MNRYVIVGNSIAGLSAIRSIRTIDSEGEITVVSAEKHRPYSKVLLTHFIAGHSQKDNLYLISQTELDSLRLHLLMGVKAVDVDVNEKKLILDNGCSVVYDNLLIATGSSPIMPQNIPQEISGITGLRTYEDAQYIKNKALSGKRTVIWGGGFVGVKLACALKAIGCSHEMIVSSPHILSKVADDEAAVIIERHMRLNGVIIRTNEDITGFNRDSSGLESVVLSCGERIPCRLLTVCKGVTPNARFVDKYLGCEGGIKVNQNMMTGLEGVYAAGDVAKTYDIATGKYNVASIWPHAVEQGRIAGLNMAGRECSYRGSLSRNALEIMGLPFISLGITSPRGRINDWDFDINVNQNQYRKLAYNKGKLVGAILLGKVDDAGKLQAKIRENNKIFDV